MASRNIAGGLDDGTYICCKGLIGDGGTIEGGASARTFTASYACKHCNAGYQCKDKYSFHATIFENMNRQF
jgi:hypothetical protein